MTLIYGYESVCHIDHAYPTKENGNPKKKSTALSAGKKCMKQTEMSTVEKAGKSERNWHSNHVTE